MILTGLLGCTSPNSSVVQTPSNPALEQMVFYTGCKNDRSTFAAAQVPQGQECVEYHYDGSNTLSLTHINTAFNCSLESISADIQIQENMLSITEYEHLENSGCHCMCLYDTTYHLMDVTPGSYRVVVARHQYSQTVDFSINLSQAVQDRFCVQRSQYPWRW